MASGRTSPKGSYTDVKMNIELSQYRSNISGVPSIAVPGAKLISVDKIVSGGYIIISDLKDVTKAIQYTLALHPETTPSLFKAKRKRR